MSVSPTIVCRLVRCSLNIELESLLEGTNRDLIKVLSYHFSGMAEENTKNLIQQSLSHAEI
jgi:hypothetical protein